MGHKLEFIKNYNVLYVEDDESTRKPLVSILEKFFNKVIVGCDGEDGYNQYCEFTQKGDDIHIIISDINMPVKNGLEMVSDIRTLNIGVPCVLLTAYNEPEYMLQAIKLGVSRYVFKPVQVPEIMQHIEEICEQKYHKQKIEKLLISQNELKQYIDTVDQVAIISKTDPKGIITYVNDIFCEVSGYSRDELIGVSHNIIRHPEISKDTFKNLWNEISQGKTWRGKLKNQAKDGTPYFVDAHIFPIYHDDGKTIKGYMGVRFLTTESEIEKRVFKQKVIQNVVNYKTSLSQYENTIEDLQQKIKLLEAKLSQFDSINLVYENLSKEKIKSKVLQKKVYELEDLIKLQSKSISFEHLKELELNLKYKESLIINLNKRLEIYQNKFNALQETVIKKDATIKELNKTISFCKLYKST